ncbi:MULTISPECIES: hypothetical protein [unclassified Coleofasciculus]|nr:MULTISPECIES: hypothetical protein [unclassified Coleofasciculus]
MTESVSPLLDFGIVVAGSAEVSSAFRASSTARSVSPHSYR